MKHITQLRTSKNRKTNKTRKTRNKARLQKSSKMQQCNDNAITTASRKLKQLYIGQKQTLDIKNKFTQIGQKYGNK